MSLLLSDIKLYGSAVMSDDDVVTNVGGAIALTRKVDFSDISGLMQIVSSTNSDTTQTVTVSYRDLTGVLTTEVKTLQGQTPVLFVANADRILKAIKSATTAGDVALESQTAIRTGTAQVGSTSNTIVLDAAASAVDGFFNGNIVRITSSTGAGAIREIIDYRGATKIATVNDLWRNPGNTVLLFSTDGVPFRIAQGMLFDKTPAEVTEVRRPFYDASASAPGGGAKAYYDKVFFKNASNALSFLTATIAKTVDLLGKISFGLDTIVNGTSSNGPGNNRQVAPAGISFGTASAVVPGTNLLAGSTIGVWLKLALLDGDAAANTSFTMQASGSTI